MLLLTQRAGAHTLIAQRAKLSSLVKKGKVFGQAFFKRLAGVRGQSPRKHIVRSEKGELKNSPVDCFLRGKSLQERDFPLRSYRFLACARLRAQ